MPLSDLLNKVQVTNGEGPRFTIPMGFIVIALGVSQAYTQKQIWATQDQVRANTGAVAALTATRVEDARKLDALEDIAMELKMRQDADVISRNALVHEWKNLGEALKESR